MTGTNRSNRGLGVAFRLIMAAAVVVGIAYAALTLRGVIKDFIADPATTSIAEQHGGLVSRADEEVEDEDDGFVALGNIDSGKDLASVEDEIRDKTYEIAAAFDADGRKLYEWTDYSAKTVEVPLELAQFAMENGQTTFLHSHTSANDGPFSKQDLRAAVARGIPEAIVVTPTRTFRLVAENGWPTLEAADRYLNDLTSDVAFAQSQGLIRITSQNSERIQYVSTTKLVEKFAEEFGLTFTVESRYATSSSQSSQTQNTQSQTGDNGNNVSGYNISSGFVR